MKNFLLSCWLCLSVTSSLANHTKGGWMYYKYAGPGAGPNTAKYIITLKIYSECTLNINQWCRDLNISIFNAGSNTLYESASVTNQLATDIQNCTIQECYRCIFDVPNICYKIATFEFTRDLPITAKGYVVAYQRCCRVANIINLQPGSSTIGETWTVDIPGNDGADPLAYQNSSAQFVQNDTAIICSGNFFNFNFNASDPDGDSLSYSFIDAFLSSRNNGIQCTDVADAPPYNFVDYIAPFSGSQPLGPGVTINSSTGMVSGIAPATQGTYVLTCIVTEYKRGTNIVKARLRKSLHINVADCSLAQASLDTEYFSCDGFTKSFSNNSNNALIKTYFWDFGVNGVTTDTSNEANPTFTYPDTGTYVLKLVVNRDQPCADSALSLVKVYPVFAPNFIIQGQCKNTPIQFIDKTTTTYGTVNSWQWDFGDPGSGSNSANIQNPNHIYSTMSNYIVSLKVTNSLGCTGVMSNILNITDKPAFQLSNDTLICIIDTLQLNAVGLGAWQWSPNYNINNQNSASPLVSPDQPTMYYATLTDPFGCVGKDSVFVDVKSKVTISGGKDTTICQTDAIVLPMSGDALKYTWTALPANASLNDPTIRNPIATPLVTTTYRATGFIGKCTAQDDITVFVVPYPKANAGSDIVICSGRSAQLQASGGSTYLWSPTAFLTNPNIANPIAVKPVGDIRYNVTVTDTLGCPKPFLSTVMVTVLKVNANAGPRDTAVVLGQPLQLQASGGGDYLWSPAQWLNNTTISNPVSIPQDDIEYILKVTNESGCADHDSIRVRVFKLTAGFLVPNAFSPNGDGRNDFFRPIAMGLKSMAIFKIFNRWGELLFSDNHTEMVGWDGTYKGNKQEPATYVWYAEGTNYLNQLIKRKGFVVLVR